MLKILQPRLQQYTNQELLDVQARFRKDRETREQIVNICWIIEKAREFQKNIYFCFTDYAKAFDYVDHNKLENSYRWEYQTTLPASWEICMQVKKQQLKPDMEQWTGTKLGKEYIKAVYCHPAYLTYIYAEYIMRNAELDDAQAGIKIAGKNINNLRYADNIILMAEGEELKSLLTKVKEECEKVGLKLNIQKTKIRVSSPITSWQIDGETWKQWETLFSWAPKSLQIVTAAMKLKDTCSLEEKLWPT